MKRSRWGCHGALGGSASTHLQENMRQMQILSMIKGHRGYQTQFDLVEIDYLEA